MAESQPSQVPLIDISAWFDGGEHDRRALAADVDTALKEIGFLLVTGHRIPSAAIRRLREEALQFFRLPTSAKARYEGSVGGRGWVPPGAESNAGADGLLTPPDVKEGFRSGPETVPPTAQGSPEASWYADNVWPREVPGLHDAASDFAAGCISLADHLLEILATALGLPAAYFTERCDINPYTVALNWYPALSEVGHPDRGQFRVGQHTDFGTLTVLDRQPGYGGLQVRSPAGEWVDAPFVPGALTINAGDLLARWSGNRWRSTPHRVLPPPAEAPHEELLSLVFFHEANPTAVIETLDTPLAGPKRFEPVTAGDFLRERLAAVTVS